MSLTKRWLEEVSEFMGLGGEITDAVMQEATDRVALIQDRGKDEAGFTKDQTEALVTGALLLVIVPSIIILYALLKFLWNIWGLGE